MRAHVLFLAVLLWAGCATAPRGAEPHPGGPRVLAVIAHPDDETAFAAAAWAVTRCLDGALDVVVVTNGEGGFKYSTLAEGLYGLELTREEVGRVELPRIRRAEMEAACALLGVRALDFLGETDQRYTQDVGEILGPGAEVWDLARVRTALRRRLADERYDAAFCLLPTPETHGHHKAATILLLEAVAALAPERRPVVLGATVEDVGDERADVAVAGLAGWPLTRLAGEDERLVFDRERRFGYREALDWGVVVDWVIAAHKSQGTLSMLAGRGAREVFWRFELGPPDGRERALALFAELAAATYPARVYGPSAGTGTAGQAER